MGKTWNSTLQLSELVCFSRFLWPPGRSTSCSSSATATVERFYVWMGPRRTILCVNGTKDKHRLSSWLNDKVSSILWSKFPPLGDRRQKGTQEMNSFQSSREFLGGPVVRTLCFHCQGHGFHPWSGNYNRTSRTARPKKTQTKQNLQCNFPTASLFCLQTTHQAE